MPAQIALLGDACVWEQRYSVIKAPGAATCREEPSTNWKCSIVLGRRPALYDGKRAAGIEIIIGSVRHVSLFVFRIVIDVSSYLCAPNSREAHRYLYAELRIDMRKDRPHTFTGVCIGETDYMVIILANGVFFLRFGFHPVGFPSAPIC